MTKALVLILTLLSLASSQECLNQEGIPVDWLLALTAPKSISEGYLFIDSLTNQTEFTQFLQKPDSEGHPIERTLSQINTMANLDFIAWNDQNPNGSTSGVKAHSKNLLIFDK